jgi:hypothetical protein
MTKGAYTKPGRLPDVLALIQVLSLDNYTHRSGSGLFQELQRLSASGGTWMTLGAEHPEFFRVATEGENQLSLVARHVVPRGVDEIKKLPSDFVHQLLQTAIELHDRQVEAAEWWKKFMPLWAALIGGIFGTASTLITIWFKGYH